MKWAALVGLVAAVAPPGCGGVSAEQAERAQRQYELAVGFVREGNAPEGFRHLEAAVSADPDNADARLLLADLYLARGDLPRAETEARRAVHARDRFPEARNSLGVVFIQERRYDDAIRELRAATDDVLYREPHLAWGNLGWAFMEAGRSEEAIAALRHAVQIEPRFCVGYYRLGEVYHRMSRWTDAAEALRRAVGVVDPACERMQDAHRLLGVALMRSNAREDAAASFRRCRDLGADTDAGRECVRFLGMLQ